MRKKAPLRGSRKSKKKNRRSELGIAGFHVKPPLKFVARSPRPPERRNTETTREDRSRSRTPGRGGEQQPAPSTPKNGLDHTRIPKKEELAACSSPQLQKLAKDHGVAGVRKRAGVIRALIGLREAAESRKRDRVSEGEPETADAPPPQSWAAVAGSPPKGERKPGTGARPGGGKGEPPGGGTDRAGKGKGDRVTPGNGRGAPVGRPTGAP